MMHEQGNFSNGSQAKRCVTTLCFLLIGLAIAVQAVHFHPDEFASDAKPCTVCQVSHAPVQVTPATITFCDFSLKEYVDSPAEPGAKPVIASFSLFCRPPPTV